jgi:alpha-ketoglutarate-dependent 2,4-dichlorophenoxyacetate dioxygenase
MWDDRATLHRGQAWPLAKPRDMVRTMISATEADGLARMRLAA